MVNVIECLQQTWLNDLLIGLIIYTGLSLCLIIILLVIMFKILNKNKGETKDGTTTNRNNGNN